MMRALALATAAISIALTSAPAHAAHTAHTEDIDPFRADPATDLHAETVRPMRFPVTGEVEYTDTFGACRGVNCSRRHMGNDLFGPKLRPLVAAQTGRVTWLRTDASGTAGNGVGITDAEGWRYLYLHVNNDTPGTDDGANPAEWRFAPGVRFGAMVEAGQQIGYLGDSGNAETTPSHLHFELRTPEGETINPHPSLRAAEDAEDAEDAN